MADALFRRLLRRIRQTGPLTVAEYMAEALHHRDGGYYTHGDPFGTQGDFVTAPEVSQMFGELIGLWTLSTWIAQGCPEPACLVELGPGRGTLMADMLRAMKSVEGLGASFDVHLVETNPALRKVQAERLREARPTWHDDISTLPDRPWFLVANEFLDALPIRQFVYTSGGWHETVVAAEENADTLVLGLDRAPSPLVQMLPKEVRASPAEGTVAELTAAGAALTDMITRQLANHGGAALFVDYGDSRGGLGGSLQAVRAHQKVDLLADPGSADISAHVDFSQIRSAAEAAGGDFHGPVGQGDFLSALGIGERTRALQENATSDKAESVRAAQHRLIAPEEMGTLFKAAAILPPGQPVPAGFPEQIGTDR